MTEKDLERVTKELLCVLKGEDYQTGMNSLCSALVSVTWQVFEKESKNILQEFCDNILKVVDDLQNENAETMPITLDD